MNFDSIFAAMYSLYRAESTIPVSTDAEYIIAMRLANEAISQWDSYDNTYWRELFTTNQLDGGGDQTIVSGTSVYEASDTFKEAGGFIRILDSNNNMVRSYGIVEPHEAQFRGDNSQYCYFSGNPSAAYSLTINPTPDTSINGFKLEYDFYKNPDLITTGSDVPEMKDPYFIVHRILANRFRASRNPYYQSALRDAEDALTTMKINNESGTWSNPWRLQDNSGSTWGQGNNTGWPW